MEFWGVEVKAGEPITVEPKDEMVLHLSQACLGETKSKGNESVVLSVNVGDQKFVLGNLSMDKFPQLSFDLVFDKKFELSHNWKNGSIHLCGYQTIVGVQDDEDLEDYDDSDEEDEIIPINAGVQNGKVAQKVEEAKPSVVKGIAAKAEPSEKPKVKIAAPSKGGEDSDESEDDSSDEEDFSEEGSDEDMLDGDDSDEDDESDDESDEETPKKPESSKKRANESAAKTPVSAKKAKIASPKSDGKKVGGHTATPHPAKKVAKALTTPATDKSKAQTPKSGGNISCKSCSKTFGSDKALESHTKAKHG